MSKVAEDLIPQVESDVPPGFRMTEIGPLPEEWAVVRLDEVMTLVRDKMDPRKAPTLPYLGLEHIDTGNPIIGRWGAASDVRSMKGRFSPGDLLYGKLRPYLDKAALADREGIASTDILIMRPHPNRLAPEYAIYCLHSRPFLAHAVSTTAGTNYPRTSWAAVGAFRLALPTLPEQRNIAFVLNSIRQAIEATDTVIAATQELKKSLMRYLFTYGSVPIDQANQAELKETEIGPVPGRWQVACLGDLIAAGPQNGLYKPQSSYGGGTPIVRINDYPNEGGFLGSGSATRRGVRLTSEEINRYKLVEGDILVNRVNSLSHLGKAALLTTQAGPMVFESNMMRFSVDITQTSPDYIFRYLCSVRAREQIRAKAKRAVAQSSINQGDVMSLTIPLPPLVDQKAIAVALQRVDHKMKAELSQKAALEALFTCVLRLLMTSQVRVKNLHLQASEVS